MLAHLPDPLRFALRGYRWFQCRHCHGIFILGRINVNYSIRMEMQAAAAHEQTCNGR